jgi:antitoxin ParD1/3/4
LVEGLLVRIAQSTYILRMNIRLPPAQQEWLEAQIAKGEFASIEDAVRQMIAERMELETDDLSWVRPYIDEGRAAAARGDVVTLEEHRIRMAKLLDSLKR